MIIDVLFQVISAITAVVTLAAFNEFYYEASVINLVILVFAIFMTIGSVYCSVTCFDITRWIES